MVYFIQGETTKLVKIGQSVNPAARLRDLQIGSPDVLKLLAAVDGSEKEFHKMFAKQRVRGEWFSLDDAMLMFGVTEGMGCDTALIMLRGWGACESIFQERGEKSVIRAVRAATRHILAESKDKEKIL